MSDSTREVVPFRRPCTRCKTRDAAGRWIAGDRPALKAVDEFRLCPSCLDEFRRFLSARSVPGLDPGTVEA